LAPDPPHLSQATSFEILSFLVVPLAISANVSFTRTRRSEPLLTRWLRCPRPLPEKPEKPPLK
jgi:hypothetical protein